MFARRLSAPSNMALYLSGVHSYVALFSFQRSSAACKRKMREAHRSSRRLVYLNKLRRVCQALFSNTFEWEEGSLHVRSTACLVYPTLLLLSRGIFYKISKKKQTGAQHGRLSAASGYLIHTWRGRYYIRCCLPDRQSWPD